jgi:hypothetical protein
MMMIFGQDGFFMAMREYPAEGILPFPQLLQFFPQSPQIPVQPLQIPVQLLYISVQ